MITIDDFTKVELKIGTVETVESVEGSEKLYKFTINMGTEVRQVLGGYKISYADPAMLIGKQVVVVANLQPRRFMLGSPEQRAGGGFESNGMILAAHDEDGKPIYLTPASPVPAGSKIS